ncbi:S8 family serine peptidase [Bacillus thuringiensis]|nr:S8 family serine peptidase [Bacillus thuringiensis]MRB60545.1 S8 family serine peptidase [Bacillus thuringiensis]
MNLSKKVIVKFHANTEIPYEDGIEKYIIQKIENNDVQSDPLFKNIKFRKLFRSLPTNQIKELIIKGQGQDPSDSSINLLSYFIIEYPGNVDLERLVNSLSSWDIVESAYVDIPGEDPSIVNPSDDPLYTYQGYLKAAPEGIDAHYAWRIHGGDGTGQSVIDLERGWTLNHEDLIHLKAQILHGQIRNKSRHHGTGVLGQIAACDNQIGCIGIVPNLKSVNVVSYYGFDRDEYPISEADAILAAIPHLEPGNVLILEVQAPIDDKILPIEIKPPVFDAIRLAIQHGIVVIEAAGNGYLNLDQYEIHGKKIFNRSSPDFRDSGAIMVGAATAGVPHKRKDFSNHGSRIDCYAWGEKVVTCSSNPQGNTTEYNYNFNGTSSATPIIAGAALAIQGIVQKSCGYRLNPARLRNLFGNPQTGTSSENPAVDCIGVMPNLRAIIDSLI